MGYVYKNTFCCQQIPYMKCLGVFLPCITVLRGQRRFSQKSPCCPHVLDNYQLPTCKFLFSPLPSPAFKNQMAADPDIYMSFRILLMGAETSLHTECYIKASVLGQIRHRAWGQFPTLHTILLNNFRQHISLLLRLARSQDYSEFTR